MTKEMSSLLNLNFEPALIRQIEKVSTYKSLEKGSILLEKESYIRSVPIITEGTLKILREDGLGNELLLYFIHPGETCAMALACCLGYTKSEVKMVAETHVEFISIPVQHIEEWSSKFKSWRKFVMQVYHQQFMAFFETIDTIAFTKLEGRLRIYLKNKQEVTQSNRIKITHQEIANDLNSSRVVISRLLKDLEKEGLIQLKHNCIHLIAL